MQSPASPATKNDRVERPIGAFAVHDYNLSFHEGSRHRLKRHGVQQLGPEILPLRLPGIDTLDDIGIDIESQTHEKAAKRG